MADRAPVTVLTGFLGSGKTTLLQKLLRSEGGARTAVLINEYGEIGIDHLIVKNVSPAAVVLQNGCICCTIRTDLRDGLRDLIDTDARTGRLYDRIVVETTGVADPVPIVQTLVNDPMLRHQVRLSSLISTIDGKQGLSQLDSQVEARRQAATADLLVLTKTDIVDPEVTKALRCRLAGVNPMAPVIDPHEEGDLWGTLLGQDTFDPDQKTAEVRAWLKSTDGLWAGSHHGHEPGHGGDIRSFSYRTTETIDWTLFAVWLSALVHRHGNQILRVKGLLRIPGAASPVLLNAVQSFVHPPVHLDGWPDDDNASRLVFITQGLESARVLRSLEHFVGLNSSQLLTAAIPAAAGIAPFSAA